MRIFNWAVLLLAVSVFTARPATASSMRTHEAPGHGVYDVPFWPDGTYDDAVEAPSELLGVEIGARPLAYEEILRYFSYLAEHFDNVSLVEYAHSYEGRALVYLTVTSEANASHLEDIRANLAKLADPRKLANDKDARAIIDASPTVAWMAYGIHGDELSSCDAAVQLAYQLVAGTDAVTRSIRDHAIVCIDPMENPDGRARWLKQIEQWGSVVPSSDIQSFNHTGVWPYGRGNHYLFDLNRDWFSLVHPESRGRVRAILHWHPQFVLDCHEMGPTDTYLFSPPRAPFNPYMIHQIYKWWDRFAKDQASALDRYGWEYYTREWNEEFFPGYGSSWGIYAGAIGMLYEQAGVDGSLVKRPDGTVMTFRETVHRQFTSSMANLTTAATNRNELLADYYNEKKRLCGMEGSNRTVDGKKSPAFVFPPSVNASRLQQFAATLAQQDIEVDVASEDFTVRRAHSYLGTDHDNLRLPKGTLIVRVNQPMHALIDAILTYDIRIPTEVLDTERKERLKNNDSKLYDTTGWSLALGYNLESYHVDALGGVKTSPYAATPTAGRIEGASARFGFAVDGADDRAMVFLARAFDAGYRVWAARNPFRVGNKRFDRGSLIIKRVGNPDLDDVALESLARSAGVIVYGVDTALGGDLADLGGSDVVLLERPRIGIVGGPSMSTYEFGSIWQLLDSQLEYKSSTLDITNLGRMDLRKYNVIVMPSSFRGTAAYESTLGKSGIKSLRDWVDDGGTLVAVGGGAAFVADTSVAITSIRERRQVLKEIAQYDDALAWADAAESPAVDSLDMWEAKTKVKDEGEKGERKKDEKAVESLKFEALKKQDELARRLRPQGAILAAAADPEHWLAFGVRSPVPVLVSTGYTFLAKNNVEVAVRLESEEHLRLSGLLWPEARARWSRSVYAARERQGKGQVIVFAVQPNFRAYFHGGERMLLNAIFLGPGFGSDRPLEF